MATAATPVQWVLQTGRFDLLIEGGGAGPDRTVYTGTAVTLFGEASKPNGLSIDSWVWSVEGAPAGAPRVLQGFDSPTADFSASLAGDYALAFFACDALACSDIDFATLHVRDNLPPQAEAFASASAIAAGQNICFDGGASSDPEGGPLTWTWDFGDGFQVAGARACHQFDLVGTFDVTLVVTDERNARDADHLTVAVAAPATVPEPATAALALLGLAALPMRGRQAIR